MLEERKSDCFLFTVRLLIVLRLESPGARYRRACIQKTSSTILRKTKFRFFFNLVRSQ